MPIKKLMRPMQLFTVFHNLFEIGRKFHEGWCLSAKTCSSTCLSLNKKMLVCKCTWIQTVSKT